jgi:superfamily II DNA or RNA helicase
MASGNNYKKSYYDLVLKNLIRLGLIVEEDNVVKLRTICEKFLGGEFKPSSSEKGGAQLPLFGILLIECMEEMGIREIDPYIVDQLAYYFDTIRKEDSSFLWSNTKILAKTAEKWPTESPLDVDPINGLTYLSTTKEGYSRVAQETLKILGVIGVIGKSANGWKLSVDEDGQEYVRKRLRKLRFQKLLEDVIREMGLDHNYFTRSQNSNFYRSVGRYICYRYSGGIAGQKGIKEQVMRELERIGNSLKKSLKLRKNEKNDILSLISKLKEKEFTKILPKLKHFDDFEQLKNSLRSMSLNEVTNFNKEEKTIDEFADLLRSRGAGKRFSRLTLNRLQHQDGEFIVSSSVVPHKWQKECVEQWVKGNSEIGHTPFTGVASAVTGTGKTVMALMAASEFVSQHNDAVISVVVPSKVLMYQWAEEAAKILGLGANEIGFVGDGFSDKFTEGRRIIIWIVNSAVKNNRLNEEVEAIGNIIPHMLIADECHEYGGEKYKLFLECRAEGRLAISATPPDETSTGDRHPVLKTMGQQFYRLGYKQAHADDLIAGFKIRYLGIELDYDERIRYTRYTDEIIRLSRELEEIYGPQLEGGNLFVRIQAIVSSGDGGAVAVQYLKAVRERKNLVREATQRDTALYAILKYMHKNHTDDFTMIFFHEQIDETRRIVQERQGQEVVKIKNSIAGKGNKISGQEVVEKSTGDFVRNLTDEDLERLKSLDFKDKQQKFLSSWFIEETKVRPGMYHSKWPKNWGSWMIELFRKGHLNVMLSARALAQGFDLPGADHGMIRTSTSNIRQRIQTIGRMIRKKEDGKEAEIWVLYVKDTTDERIFEKFDWEEELPEVEDVQTAWKLNMLGDSQNIAEVEYVGGVEELPQPNRELTEEELQSLSDKEYEVGDDYDKRAILSSTKIISVSEEGLMTIIDAGAPFEVKYPLLSDGAKWLANNRKKRGRIHIISNGHAVGRTKIGRVVFLAKVDIDELEETLQEAVDEGDSWESFSSGFNMNK